MPETETLESLEKQLAEADEHKLEVAKMLAETDGWGDVPKEDVAAFVQVQAVLLEALWCILAPGGKLLYVTCSVFPAENQQQTRAFLARHPEASTVPLSGLGDGQILPSPDRDGFYYALLQKRR